MRKQIRTEEVKEAQFLQPQLPQARVPWSSNKDSAIHLLENYCYCFLFFSTFIGREQEKDKRFIS